MDLYRAGLIEHPLLGMNASDLRWMEDLTFTYRLGFEARPAAAPERTVVFTGIDGIGSISVDDRVVLQTRNAFRRYSISIPNDQRPHELSVDVNCGRDFATGFDRDRYLAHENVDRIFLRKPQFSFGWDWAPRLPSCGLWKDVFVCEGSLDHVLDTSIRVTMVNDIVHDATVDIALVTADPLSRQLTGTCRLIDPTGAMVAATADIIPINSESVISLSVSGVHRWYPRGYGEQPMYIVETTLFGEPEEPPRVIRRKLGFRTVRVDRSPDGIGERFQFNVNGVPVRALGANWVPPHQYPAEIANDRYDSLMVDFRDTGANMVRVWGGGVYESDHFFDLCDEHGIMVWHDFMFACAEYPDDQPWFVSEVVKEATEFCRRVCHHPSLVLLCGNNENHWIYGYYKRGVNGRSGPFFGQALYDVVLPHIVDRETTGIPYWPSSPFGGTFPNADEVGDKHAWAVSILHPDMQYRADIFRYRGENASFISEYGVLSAPLPSSAGEFLGIGTDSQLDRHSEAYRFHDNTLNRRHIDELPLIDHYLREAYGSVPHDTQDYMWKSLFYQARGYREAIAAHRSSTRCCGSLLWMFTDCWGTGGWTLIDFFGRRKPSWYWVRRAYQPVAAFLFVEDKHATTIIVNDTRDPVIVDVSIRSSGNDAEKVISGSARVAVEPGSRAVGPSIYSAFGMVEVVVRDRESQDDSTLFLDCITTHHPRVTKCRPPQLTTTIAEKSEYTEIRVLAETNIHCAVIEHPDSSEVSDNYFGLLAGSSRVIRCYGAGSEQIRVWALPHE